MISAGPLLGRHAEVCPCQQPRRLGKFVRCPAGVSVAAKMRVAEPGVCAWSAARLAQGNRPPSARKPTASERIKPAAPRKILSVPEVGAIAIARRGDARMTRDQRGRLPRGHDNAHRHSNRARASFRAQFVQGTSRRVALALPYPFQVGHTLGR
jgi:hypothetical protein